MGPIDRQLWLERETNPEPLRREVFGDKGRGWLLRWLPARAHDNGMFLVFANGIGPDDDEIRTGNAMVIDCYGRILGESSALGEDLVVADLKAALRERCTGVRWIKARRPELYGPLAVPTGREQDTRKVRFEYGGQ
jgi:predicted amidohydrolase